MKRLNSQIRNPRSHGPQVARPQVLAQMSKKRPITPPPVYRPPQPPLRAVQPKTAAPVRRQPTPPPAPPVYRPQPLPRVLQPKTAPPVNPVAQQPGQAAKPPVPPVSSQQHGPKVSPYKPTPVLLRTGRPVASAVYRPQQPPNVLQGKVLQGSTQPRAGGLKPHMQAPAPPHSAQAGKQKCWPLPPPVGPAPRLAARPLTTATVQRKIGPNAVGKKIVNKKTGKRYVANSGGEPGKYSLTELDYIFYPSTIIVDENDADYDILLESPTEQNYRARRNSIDRSNNNNNISSQATETLVNKLIQSEKQRAPNEHVFYNSAGPGARAIHKITKILVANLHAIQGHIPDCGEFEFLRAPSHQSNSLMSMNPRDFLDCVLQKNNWSDRDEPKPVLSTNMSIFGDINAGGSENSFTIYFKNGLFDVDENKACGIVDSLLKSYSLDERLSQELMRLTVQFINTLQKERTNPAIYQIFVSDEILDQLVYISMQSGLPLDHSLARNTYGLQEKMGGKLRQTDARSTEFTRGVLESAQTEDYWKKFKGGNDPQARLIANPNFFATPNNLVRIRVFEEAGPTSKLFELFNREVYALCQKYVKRYYQKLVKFIKQNAQALETLKIDFSIDPLDCSISILNDYLRTLPKIMELIEGLSKPKNEDLLIFI